MNNDYKNLVKESPLLERSSGYEIYVCCDANDGDCIDDRIYVNDLFNDELLFLVLCYLYTEKAFGYPNKDENVFGNYIGGYSEGDKFFDWIEDYCIDKNLLLFAGMCDCFCHSVEDISITHLSQGKQYNVILPTIDKIFDNEIEMKDYINKLYEQSN